MQIQQKYDQTIYNIIQLIQRKKYRRAIRVAQHLEAQGISTNELTVLISYAINASKGPNAALISLNRHDSPLINLAKSQYQQSLDQHQEAICSYQKLIVQKEESAVDILAKNSQILINPTLKQENNFNNFRNKEAIVFTIDRKQEQCVHRVNHITQTYQLAKELKSKGLLKYEDFLSKCCQFRKQYEQILATYRPKQDLKLGIEKFIQFLTEIVGSPSQ